MSENTASTKGTDLPISTKVSIEICNMLRNKSIKQAKDMLSKVADMKMAVPYRRFNKDVGHKPKIGPGRYPVNASKIFLKLVEEADANAQIKGLNSANLVITQIKADKGANTWRYGRRRRIKAKRTHVTLVVEEKAQRKAKKSDAKKPDAEVKKEAVKKEEPKEVKKEETRPVEKKVEEKPSGEKKPEVKVEEKKEEEKAEVKKEGVKKEEAKAEEPKAEEKIEAAKAPEEKPEEEKK